MSEEAAGNWPAYGQALLKQKRFAEALEIFKRAIALNPKDREAWNGQTSARANLDREKND